MTEFRMLSGLPASGKSTYAESLAKDGWAVHSSDAIREELFGTAEHQEDTERVFQLLRERVKRDLSEGRSCVMDATNLSRKKRMSFLRELARFSCKKKCVLFLVPVAVCKERNAGRQRRVPDHVIEKMLKAFQCPQRYEGWDEVEIKADSVQGYRYPFEETVGFDQKNIHHDLTLAEHMESAWKYTAERGFSEQVQLAARYHDCGKLYTQTFRNFKGEVTENAHYYGHENYSAYLFLLEMFGGGSQQTASEVEILYVTALINWHMMPLTSWKMSAKSGAKDRAMIGEKLFLDIMRLHEADRAAHGKEEGYE